MGEILLERDGPAAVEEAESRFRRSLEIARGQRARSFELRTATSLGRLLASRGRSAEVRDLVGPVYDCFTEGFETRDLEDARALLHELGVSSIGGEDATPRRS